MSSTVGYFAFPTNIAHGPGALQELPAGLERLSCRRPLVVTDSGLLPTEAFDLLSAALGHDRRETGWHVFDGVHANPAEQDVIDAAKAFRKKDCDGIVAFGGGSALDVGKACRLIIKRPHLKLAQFDFK